MTLQTEFDKTINLLNDNRNFFPLVEKLLDNYKNLELTFYYFDEPSTRTEKKHLLDIYEVRAKIEEDRKDNPHVFGYDTLLPKFRQTKHQHICVSGFTTNIGSFIIFSDFDKKDLIGVLFSKTTLQSTRDKMTKHRKIVEATGGTVQYDYTKKENVFINGQLQAKGSS